MPQQRDPNSKKAAAFSARQKIMEQQIPIPSLSLSPLPATPTQKKFQGWRPAQPKTCHFPILDLKWGWGL